MTLSRRPILALCGTVGGIVLLAALATSPATAGGAAVPALGAGCGATAHVDSEWGGGTTGGQIVSVKVTNTSAATTTAWTVSWPLGTGRRVVSAWNATVTATDGQATAVNAAHNGVLAPGAGTTFGMHLSGVGPAPVLDCATGTPPVTSPPPGGPDVPVTQADNGGTVTLLAGQTLGVSLGSDFVTPTTGGTALTRLSTGGGYPTGRPLTALYRAVTPGPADVTSQTDYACLHTTPPCAVPIARWTVHVEVLAAGRTVTVTTADNLSTVRLRAGDTLVVSLTKLHLPPKLSAAGVLAPRDVTGGYPTGQPLVARYVAAAPGAVDVSTTTDAPCNHEPTPCPSPAAPWVVHVVVTA